MNITRAIRILDRFSYFVSKACAALTGLLIFIISVTIFIYIIERAFIGAGWEFVEEWTSIALVAITYLGMGYAVRWQRHIKVDILTKHFSMKVQHLLGIVVAILCLIVICCMVERACDMLVSSWVRNTRALGPMLTPLWIPNLCMLIGLIICGLDFICYGFDQLFRLCLGEDHGLRFFKE